MDQLPDGRAVYVGIKYMGKNDDDGDDSFVLNVTLYAKKRELGGTGDN